MANSPLKAVWGNCGNTELRPQFPVYNRGNDLFLSIDLHDRQLCLFVLRTKVNNYKHKVWVLLPLCFCQ